MAEFLETIKNNLKDSAKKSEMVKKESLQKSEEIRRKIQEKSRAIKEDVEKRQFKLEQRQLENLLEVYKTQSDFLKKTGIEKQFPFVSDLTQKKLDKILERSENLALPDKKSERKSPVERLFEYKDLEKQLKLVKYIKRVNELAADKILDDKNFADKFINTQDFCAVILSVDIRRSTELMLKCKSAEVYVEFISVLAEEFENAVKNRFGVYDKFTGDGFLSFFPDFYSGKEALVNAVLCAADCKEIFDTVFDEYKENFDLGQTVTGIGGGIDVGRVYAEGGEVEYSVVGAPVVYACRFSSAPSGHLYLTENAKSAMDLVNGGRFSLSETSIPIKHENNMRAFDIFLEEVFPEKISCSLPDWI